jgi:hypothetical protein
MEVSEECKKKLEFVMDAIWEEECINKEDGREKGEVTREEKKRLVRMRRGRRIGSKDHA